MIDNLDDAIQVVGRNKRLLYRIRFHSNLMKMVLFCLLDYVVVEAETFWMFVTEIEVVVVAEIVGDERMTNGIVLVDAGLLANDVCHGKTGSLHGEIETGCAVCNARFW